MDNPSGAVMVARTQKVTDRVKKILLEYPSTKGDDTLLIYRYLCRYHPQVRLTFSQFKSLLFIPAFETIRRRRQEWQEKISDGNGGEVPRYPELCPTERVKRKRARNEQAIRHEHGKGLTLNDFEGDFTSSNDSPQTEGVVKTTSNFSKNSQKSNKVIRNGEEVKK